MTVFMESEEFGYEEFGPYATLDDALAGIRRLYNCATMQNDGVARSIGVLFQPEPDEDE